MVLLATIDHRHQADGAGADQCKRVKSLLAQHDGQPVGELRPTNTWQAGEIVIDQFAIPIPTDAPAGEYRLRIGLYLPGTGQRLPYTTPGGQVEEAWIGGQITIP